MLFSSVPFLFYFAVATALAYFLVALLTPRHMLPRNAVLLLSSLFFYGWGEPKYLALMIFSILAFYGYGLAIFFSKSQKVKKLWLLLSVVTGVALLGVFKYADFFVSSFNAATGLAVPLLHLALPIGISFYTFQCMSYVVDVYRGQVEAQKNPISFGAYVSFFPQLIAGPIVRYVDIAQELKERSTHADDLYLGLRRFLTGLAKKVLLANQFGELTALFRASGEKSLVFYWVYAIAFTLHIYFDFSGYSDMAIGLGRIFGFRFPENFNYPYLSKSVTEFWRRWHMTLGGWFRDYVYIPLGGNRVGKFRWVLNILAVWMLTGLWHGAAWNFVLWGLLFAALLLLEKWVPALQKLPKVLRHGYVLLAVVLSFVLFNANDMAQAGQDFAGLFGLAGLPLLSTQTVYYLQSYLMLFILGFMGATPLPRMLEARLPEKVRAVLEPVGLIALLLLCSGYLVDGSYNPFLYFRF